MTEPNDHILRNKFDVAIHKIFRSMDLFSRGVISDACINKWIPEAALYFLGSVFQKIKHAHLVLTQEQFHDECIKLFRKSSEADIQEFLENIDDFLQSRD